MVLITRSSTQLVSTIIKLSFKPVTTLQPSHLCLTRSRWLSTSSVRHERPFVPSITFGEETDRLIADLDNVKPKRRNVSKEKDSSKAGTRASRTRDGELKAMKAPRDDRKTPRKPRAILKKSAEAQHSKIMAAEDESDEVYGEPVVLELPESSPSHVTDSEAEHISLRSRDVEHDRSPIPAIPYVRPSPSRRPAQIPDPSSSSSLPPRAPKPDLEPWAIQKNALTSKFSGSAWQPRKRLSPDHLEGIRSLHAQDATRFSTANLATQFEVSPEAIRRILKSKWKPSAEEDLERRQRWARRHDRIWDVKAAIGLKPRRRKDREVVGDAAAGQELFEEEVKAKVLLGKM